MDLVRRIGVVELVGDVREIGEGELAGVGAIADTEENDIFGDEIARGTRWLALLDREL
jgi:hypothetical protein